MNHALCKRGLNAFAKSIDLRHPAQSAQADMGRNFSLLLNLMRFTGPFYLMNKSVYGQNLRDA